MELNPRNIINTSLNTCLDLLASNEQNNIDQAVVNILNLISFLEDNNSLFLQLCNIVLLLEDALVLLQYRQLYCCLRGRPKIVIPEESLEYLVSLNFRVPVIAKMYNVSTKTIFRRFKDCNLLIRRTYSTIGHEELETQMRLILLRTPNTGYKRMKGYLLLQGIKVTERRVREAMRHIDPLGVSQRTTENRAIVRREYFVRYSNDMWHIDTNMKLIRWNIVIRGAVDGKSRMCLFLEASNDNRADTNFLAFMKGVELYGIPSRTRTDKGGENVLIARYIIETRGLNRASHICGRSVHNQRIERFWRDVTYGVSNFFKSIFIYLEENHILNIDNENHLFVLQHIFMPRINNCLHVFAQGWNLHPLSSEHNMSPTQLMLLNLPPSNYDMHLSQSQYDDMRFVCETMDDLNHFDAEDTITLPLVNHHSLNTEQLTYLNNVEVLQHSVSYGCNIFTRAIREMDLMEILS